MNQYTLYALFVVLWSVAGIFAFPKLIKAPTTGAEAKRFILWVDFLTIVLRPGVWAVWLNHKLSKFSR